MLFDVETELWGFKLETWTKFEKYSPDFNWRLKTALHCTALHCTALAALYFTMACSKALCCTALYCTVAHRTGPYCTVLVIYMGQSNIRAVPLYNYINLLLYYTKQKAPV